jgi:hypothetical protein
MVEEIHPEDEKVPAPEEAEVPDPQSPPLRAQIEALEAEGEPKEEEPDGVPEAD